MPGVIGSALIAQGAGEAFSRISSAFRPKAKAKTIDPGRLTALSSARSATQNALTQANIKQAGAAGRLPAGAISSSLANAGVNAPAGDPGLDLARLNVDKFNVGQQNRAEDINRAEFDATQNFTLANLGTLSKIALLAQMGLLSPGQPGGGAGAGGGQDLGQLSAINPDQLQGILTG